MLIGKSRIDKPIITRRTQKDWYYVTTGFFAWLRHRNVQVRWGFKNRTKNVRLGERIDFGRLREEVAHVATLEYTDEDLARLWNRYGIDKPDGFLPREYLEFLRTSKLSDYDLELVNTPDGPDIRFEPHGAWCEGLDWETFFLPIITYLNGDWVLGQNHVTREQAHIEGMRRWRQKVEILRQYPELRYGAFGLRRQFDFELSREISEYAIHEIPRQLAGISHVALALDLDWPVIGTYPHLAPMIYSGICEDTDEAIRASHMQFYDDWMATFGPRWTTAVPDTFGSKSFFEDFGAERARLCPTFKQDSGNPFEEADKYHDWLVGLEVDPLTKVFNPTDGLSIDTIPKLYAHCRGKFKAMMPGWGTTKTNDVGLPTFGSFVVKAIQAAARPGAPWRDLCKLTGDLNKACGKPDTIARFARIHGYDVTLRQECIV